MTWNSVKEFIYSVYNWPNISILQFLSLTEWCVQITMLNLEGTEPLAYFYFLYGPALYNGGSLESLCSFHFK